MRKQIGLKTSGDFACFVFCHLVKAVYCAASPLVGLAVRMLECNRRLDIADPVLLPSHKNCTTDTKASHPPCCGGGARPVVFEKRGDPSRLDGSAARVRVTGRSAGPGQHRGMRAQGQRRNARGSTSCLAPTRPGATGAGKESEVRSGWLEESCVCGLEGSARNIRETDDKLTECPA